MNMGRFWHHRYQPDQYQTYWKDDSTIKFTILYKAFDDKTKLGTTNYDRTYFNYEYNCQLTIVSMVLTDSHTFNIPFYLYQYTR